MIRRIALSLSIIVLTLTSGRVWAQAPDDVVAKVGERVILRKDLDRRLTLDRASLERQWHAHSIKALDDMAQQELLRQEAARRGLSVDELLKREVDARVPVITDGDVEEFIQANQSRLRGGGPEVRQRVRQTLEKQARDVRRRELMTRLREATVVELLLVEPEPPSVQVGTTGAGALGPADAPVTMIEFSDFQCPYCQSVKSTLKQLRERYGDRLRIVFRDFPIPELHPEAVRSAEAARCAGAQGKFWPYHDLLFANQGRQKPDDLARYARELGLTVPRFEECLAKGEFAGVVAADIAEARSLGVTGTPTFFINGRPLPGAQSLEAFDKRIEAELRRVRR